MALKGLDIFKLSPKKNCKECGSPTCMAFCMKVAQGAVAIDKCPYFSDDAKAMLNEQLQLLRQVENPSFDELRIEVAVLQVPEGHPLEAVGTTTLYEAEVALHIWERNLEIEAQLVVAFTIGLFGEEGLAQPQGPQNARFQVHFLPYLPKDGLFCRLMQLHPSAGQVGVVADAVAHGQQSAVMHNHSADPEVEPPLWSLEGNIHATSVSVRPSVVQCAFRLKNCRTPANRRVDCGCGTGSSSTQGRRIPYTLSVKYSPVCSFGATKPSRTAMCTGMESERSNSYSPIASTCPQTV